MPCGLNAGMGSKVRISLPLPSAPAPGAAPTYCDRDLLWLLMAREMADQTLYSLILMLYVSQDPSGSLTLGPCRCDHFKPRQDYLRHPAISADPA